MEITSPESGLALRVDFCPRCGVLWGQVVGDPLNYVLKEEFEVLSRKTETNLEKKEV